MKLRIWSTGKLVHAAPRRISDAVSYTCLCREALRGDGAAAAVAEGNYSADMDSLTPAS